MLKHMLKQLVRKEGGGGRGFRAPALLLFARPSLFVQRLGRASRGYLLAGTGVVAAAVVFVSLLSWLAPDSDRPFDSPLEVIERVAGGVLEQVDEQVTAMLGTDGESVLRSVRGDAAVAGSRIPWAGERLRQIATDRSASAGPTPIVPAMARPTPNTASQAAQEKPFSSSPTSTNESSAPQATGEPSSGEPSPPSSASSSPDSIGEMAPPAEEEPAPTTSEPRPPPPATKAPSPAAGEPPSVEEPSTTPPIEEPLPAAEEPPPTTDEPAPPATEEPPPPPVMEEPPPSITDQPALPPKEGPPPATNQPPSPTNQPPPIPPIITQPLPTGAHGIDRSGDLLGFLYPLGL